MDAELRTYFQHASSFRRCGPVTSSLRLRCLLIVHRRKYLWGPDGDILPLPTERLTICIAALRPDLDRFDYDRLNRYDLPNPFGFLTFFAGPRICLGQQVRHGGCVSDDAHWLPCGIVYSSRTTRYRSCSSACCSTSIVCRWTRLPNRRRRARLRSGRRRKGALQRSSSSPNCT